AFHAVRVTASPAVVTLDLPGEHRMAVAFVASWDGGLYALRVRDGTLLCASRWRNSRAPPFPKRPPSRSRPSTDARAHSRAVARGGDRVLPRCGGRRGPDGREGTLPRLARWAGLSPEARVAGVVSLRATEPTEDAAEPTARARRSGAELSIYHVAASGGAV